MAGSFLIDKLVALYFGYLNTFREIDLDLVVGWVFVYVDVCRI